jgi:curli biogenesis system outer membrane secretion channel CsgG
MPKPSIRIVNAETGEVIDREMTDAEFKAYQADRADIAAAETDALAKAADKAALLAKLGITADEAALLLG